MRVSRIASVSFPIARPLPGLIIFLMIGCVGCEREPSVVHQKIERADSLFPPPENQRLRALMVENKDFVWFAVMSGAESVVKANDASFDAFVRSIKFGDNPPISWKLPAGWQEQPGANRFATLHPEGAPPGFEVRVNRFPNEQGMREVLPNVDRWAKQIGRPGVTEEELPQVTKTIQVDDRRATLVDLTGPPAKAHRPVPPMMAQQPPPRDLGATKITYETPKDWNKVVPAKKEIREQFDIDEGGEKVQVTISAFPGTAGGLPANVNRWRKQVQLPPIVDEEELVKDVVMEKAGKHTLLMVDVANAKAPAPNRILGVIIPTHGAVWFLKMHGGDAAVGKHKADFEIFAKSFRIVE
jgi:hypothetical protein